VFDADVGVEFRKLLVYKLSTIIGYDGVWYTIAVYDVFPDELLDLLSCDIGYRFSFYPFGEVVDGYY